MSGPVGGRGWGMTDILWLGQQNIVIHLTNEDFYIVGCFCLKESLA